MGSDHHGFIMGLPIMNKQHDSIMVVVEKLTKASHFVPVKKTHTVANIAKKFHEGNC
jgi:hypothetical protein